MSEITGIWVVFVRGVLRGGESGATAIESRRYMYIYIHTVLDCDRFEDKVAQRCYISERQQ